MPPVTVKKDKPDTKKGKNLGGIIVENVKVPVTFILNLLKKDDNLEKYMTQEDINYVLYMIDESKIPKDIDNVDEIIDSIHHIIKLYFENKSRMLSIGSGVIIKYITDKIRSIIIKYKVRYLRSLKINRKLNALTMKRYIKRLGSK